MSRLSVCDLEETMGEIVCEDLRIAMMVLHGPEPISVTFKSDDV